MFYVQHLLGVGHLKRAALIARALQREGLAVTVVLGGPDMPGVNFDGCARILLPPVRAADPSFKTLLDAAGQPISTEWKDHRAARLLAEFDALRPDLVLIELFPFGRLQFRFELLPLLQRAYAAPRRPAIVSSVRDALVHQEDPERRRLMVALAAHWFDRILVHGDCELLPLTETLPEAGSIAEKITYTGYVTDNDDAFAAQAAASEAGRGEVLVTAGGGAVGEPLLRAALAARPLTALANRVWRVITGPNLSTAVFDELAWSAPDGVVVERWRNDLPILLRNCAVSISQAGYNTIMDVLQAGARAVAVPFAEAGETEQLFRANRLASLGLLTVVDPRRLSAKLLAQAIDQAAAGEPPTMPFDFSGAATTARLLREICLSRPPA